MSSKVIHVDWESWAARASGNMAKMLGPKCFLADAPAIKFTPPGRLCELSSVLDSPVLPGIAEWLKKQGIQP